ncbi:type II and III secretion system protein family protein [Dryocola clanedunensis]
MHGKYLRRLILLISVLAFNVNALEIDIDKTKEINVDFPIKSVIVGSPDVADFRIVDEKYVYLFGKKAGQTNVTVTGEGRKKKVVAVKVNDLSEQAVTLSAMLISEGYKEVKVVSMGGELLVNGTVETNEDADYVRDLISESASTDNIRYSLVTQKNQQIKIRVTVAEVSKNVSETLGIEWGQAMSGMDDVTGGGGGTLAELTVSGGVYHSLVRGFNFDALGVAINALAKNNLATVLTTPSLTVTNGKSASFHGGGEIPIFQRTEEGSTVEWKDYGVMLNFTPVINSDSTISMDVSVESSQIAGYYRYEGSDLPTIKTRNVKTSVRMKNGESFVLGGLIDNSQTQYVNKVPGLADIPIFGSLFKSTGFTTGRSELVVFATVEYVKPTEQKNIKLPYVRFSSPWEIYFGIKEDSNINSVTSDFIKGADYVIQ